MNDLSISRSPLDPDLRQSLIQYVYGIIGCMQYVHDGEQLESYIKMDMVVMMPRGNVIIECKSIKAITDKEQFQTFGYLRGTLFPIAILVNFGTWPKAQIERYYYHDGVIRAF